MEFLENSSRSSNQENQKSNKSEKPQDQLQNHVTHDLSSYKKTIDLTIEAKTETVKNIFESLKSSAPGLIEGKHKEEFTMQASEQLFLSVAEQYRHLEDRLTSPEVKDVLNNDLITQKVLPKLNKSSAKGTLTGEETKEYINLLKLNMGKPKHESITDYSKEEWQISLVQSRRLRALNSKTDDAMVGISSHYEGADKFYDRIFDVVLREGAKEKIEELRNSLSEQKDNEQQKKIAQITEKIIDHPSNWGDKPLDLDKIDFAYFGEDFKGLERWPIVKNFCESTGIIPKEVFDNAEKIIIQRLFDRELFHRWNYDFPHDAPEVAKKMADLGNPGSLPLMLRYIKVYGETFAGPKVVKQMLNLLGESDPKELQKTLEGLPKDERLLLQIFADENSYLRRIKNNRDDNDLLIYYRLKNGNKTIVKEQLAKVLEESGELYKEIYNEDEKEAPGYYSEKDHWEKTQEKIRGFYNLYFDENDPQIFTSLMKARGQVEKAIIDSKASFWTQSADKLLAAFVNPANEENTSFSKRIAQEGLGITDEKLLGVLDQVLTSKSFKESNFEREAFLDGLILLNSRENGKAVLETLLTAYRGTKNDPTRMRHIFQLLSTLDGFGEYTFITPDKSNMSGINQEIADLQNQYPQIQDKTEKKKIKDKIETRNRDMQNLTGLKGVEDTMRQKVSEVACRRLELPQEYRDKIQNKLEELLKNGLFEIIPTLAGTYEKRDETEVKKLLKTITTHIIDGDFQKWRYSHERSKEQLAGLSSEEKEFWKKNLEPVTIDIAVSEDEKSRRSDELKAAQEIVKNAKEHILESRPNYNFSKNQLTTFNEQIIQLTEKIKSASSDDEKKAIATEKRTLQANAILIEKILDIENATPNNYKKETLTTQAREIGEKILELKIPLAGLDMEQIGKIFTVGDIKSVTAYESDDALTLLKVGVEPQETCQSWRNGELNECLLAYVADSNKKVLNVADDEGKIVLRSMFKVTDQEYEDNSGSKNKTLLVEKPYALLPNKEVYRAFIRVLLTKAQGLNASITFGRGFDNTTIKIFEEEAQAFGYGKNESNLEVFIPPSLNKYEYSDTLGGKITEFGIYKQLEAITFDKMSK